MNPMRCLVIVVVLLNFCVATRAENWPQWRGPNLNGSTTETGLPEKLDPQSNLLWQAAMPGHSNGTPIVWDDRVFVSSLDKQTQKTLAICLNNKTGQMLWKREVGDGFLTNDRNDMATPSPITDGKTVWFYYGTGDLAAFDMDGKPLWQRSIQKDYGNFNIQWYYGSSPLLYNGKLYVQVIHRDVPSRGPRGAAGTPPAESYLLAVDPATGKDLFRVVRPESARAESKESYTTPIPAEFQGRKQIILVGGDCVTGHDADTGKELWRYGGWNPGLATNWRMVPGVVVVDGKAIFCTPQNSNRVVAISLDGSGDVSGSHKAWENTQANSDVPVPLLYQGNLYVLDGDRRKGITCLDPKTGQTKWSAPVSSRSVLRASPTGADGKIYIMNEAAEVWVLSAADGKVLSQIELSTELQSRGTIIAAQGKVFVRTGSTLYCFANK